MTLLLFAACTPAPTAEQFGEDELAVEMVDYTSWGAPGGWEGLRASCERSHGPYVRLYANEIAAGSTSGTFPTGALLVNASFQDTSGTPKLLAAMRKLDDDSWFWAVFDEQAAPVLTGDIPTCAACHRAGADSVWSATSDPADAGTCDPGDTARPVDTGHPGDTGRG